MIKKILQEFQYHIISEKIEEVKTEIIILETELSICMEHPNNPHKEIYIKMYKNDLKYNKLFLFMMQRFFNPTFTINFENMVLKKMEESMIDKIEILSELVQVGEIDEGEYLEMTNRLKIVFEQNQDYKNFVVEN